MPLLYFLGGRNTAKQIVQRMKAECLTRLILTLAINPVLCIQNMHFCPLMNYLHSYYVQYFLLLFANTVTTNTALPPLKISNCWFTYKNIKNSYKISFCSNIITNEHFAAFQACQKFSEVIVTTNIVKSGNTYLSIICSVIKFLSKLLMF